ncbi:MAG: glycosyltransferase family 2 protein [Symbiobacterium sp.]|uniref:glycosyltransferase family 2 protein n=1 Tax=Symbiobacterium sp. TaxID=1971213 RepID=UPI003463E329
MRVAAVIPAFNEEETIADVVSVCVRVPEIEETIVVDDGSTDETAARAKAAGARVISHAENRGKAAAMKTGFEATTAPVLLFLDADLIGLQPDHLQDLLRPVLAGEADMTVGVFGDGRVATDLAQMVAPYLSGQRAIVRSVLAGMFQQEPDAEQVRFGIEVAITKYVRSHGCRVVEVVLEEMTHRMKEEKFGLMKGAAARLKMYYEILKYVQKG